MEYVGLFLILVAAGLRLLGRHFFARAGRQPRSPGTFYGIYAVSPGAAAFLVAAAGVFIFFTSIGTR
ncbi:hypothetical protein AB4Z38_09010 [Arthrobacter sp. 2RAF6]|uniref:hypothetical protein n=1 Tax=Arthrobacter sp. 2RAF6 TaxID=3233002 RepID=UPI003F92571A